MTHLATTTQRALDTATPTGTAGFRTYYVYDGNDVAFTLVRPSSGTTWRIQQRYVNTGLDENIAARLWLNGTPTSLALVTDRQGGYIMGVRGDGTEETSTGFYLRNAFGKMESGSTAASSMETHTGLGFAGAGTPTSAAGGYVYLRNRWYDPGTGRFLSQDPIGLAGGVNLYAYAGNNPAAYVDPFGLCANGPADSIKVQVTVFCGGDPNDAQNYEIQTVIATRVTDAKVTQTIKDGAGRLKGGSVDYSPDAVAAELQSTAAEGTVYVYGATTADGLEITSPAATVGQSIALRSDLASQLGGGVNFIHRRLGGKYQTACQIIGHEGVHLVQHRAGRTDSNVNEREALAISWRCR